MGLIESGITEALEHLPSRFHDAIRSALNLHFKPHGDSANWEKVLSKIPCIDDSNACFTADAVHVTTHRRIDTDHLEQQLKRLMPWRKGPWHLLGVDIDAEWRSHWKWQRLHTHITPLQQRRVLDIGCGNGYYLFRMLGEGARLALGVDPAQLFLYQFLGVQKLVPSNNAFVLPLQSANLPPFNYFDTVFSMGVLYHRRSPMDHLAELFSFLRPGGELVLETLVVPGDELTSLVPPDRYAKMINVWFLPGIPALELWLHRIGFINVRVVDTCRTTTEEQRKTTWMTFESLKDFLHPEDPTRTIEGFPAPARAILIATKPLRS